MEFTKIGLAATLSLVLLSGCKGDNQMESDYYSDRDFSVQCLYGYKYLTRKLITGRILIVPKFDPITSLPERCDK